MNLILRLIRVLLAALRRPKLDMLAESEVAFRVWPNDLDFNWHMNNGRYLTIMDLGRFDLMARSGMTKIMRERRWMPVVASQTITFLRSLKPWQRYVLRTRVLGWDEKFFYLQQNFHADGKPVARAVVKAAFVGGKRRVTVQESLQAAGITRGSPKLPADVKAWALAEDLQRESAPRLRAV